MVAAAVEHAFAPIEFLGHAGLSVGLAGDLAHDIGPALNAGPVGIIRTDSENW
ncbi:MAG: hypothetical protein ACNA7M_02710 [Roseovarius sp.]